MSGKQWSDSQWHKHKEKLMAVKLPRIKGLRLIGTEVDAETAIHVGGPIQVRHVTFDVPCPEDLALWMQHGRRGEKSIVGVELLFDRDPPSLDMGVQKV
jgi:hypothetical protein